MALCIIPYNFIFAYKINSQTVSAITDKINDIKNILGYKIFPIILTDNSGEFKRPGLMEDNGEDVVKIKVFFCASGRSDQKGSIEITHEYIRRFIEKSIDFDKYNDEQIQLIMNYINNTKREKLNGNTPFNLLENKISSEAIKKLGYYYIEPKDITLKPSLFIQFPYCTIFVIFGHFTFLFQPFYIILYIH